MNKKKSAPKSRAHRELFTHDTPYGHKVQKDKTKVIPRKEKNKKDIT